MQDPADLDRVGTVVRRRIWTVIFGTVLVLGAVSGLTYVWPKTYESSATILVEKRSPKVDVPVLAVLERMGGGNETETEIELIQSRSVVESVVDRLDLHVTVEKDGDERRPAEVFPEFHAGRQVVPGSYRIASASNLGYVVTEVETGSIVTESAAEDPIAFAGLTIIPPDEDLSAGIIVHTTEFPRAVENALNRLSVSRVQRDADLIRLTCKATTAEAARMLCDGVSDSYTRLRAELQRAEATATAKFLRGQVERLGERLAAAEDSLEAYSRRNRVVALEERASEEVRQYARLIAQRDQLEAERSALAALSLQIELDESAERTYRDLASFPTFMTNQVVTDLLANLVDLENQRSELALRRSEVNPDLAAVDERITDIENQLRSMSTSYQQALLAQIASIDRSLESAGRRLAIIPTQQVRTARLERQAGQLEDLYRTLEMRLREAEVAEAVTLPSVRLVDSASQPLDPTAPNVPRNIALGLILGLAYGFSLAFFREFRDKTFHDREAVVRETGLPVLTTIPRLRRPGPVLPLTTLTRPVERVEAATPPGGFGLPMPAPQSGRRRKPARRKLSRLAQERLAALESFRSLAADLRFAERELGNGTMRSLAITSSGRGEGKTFTACNLALTRAAGGGRTLLIDADMRSGRVSKYFGLPSSSPGLAEVLSGRSQVQSVWHGMQVNDAELWVLPAGTLGPQSAGLLNTRGLELMLVQADLQFDLIVIDTPPLNGVADAATVASAADGVVVVVRCGITDRHALEMMMERLRRADGLVVGTILNDVKKKESYAAGYDYGAGSDQASAWALDDLLGER